MSRLCLDMPPHNAMTEVLAPACEFGREIGFETDQVWARERRSYAIMNHLARTRCIKFYKAQPPRTLRQGWFKRNRVAYAVLFTCLGWLLARMTGLAGAKLSMTMT
jgi:hypothetical protein